MSSSDTSQRPDNGLDDGLRERLRHLGHAGTAGSLPWPGVDDAIRRRRTATAGAAGLVTAAVLLTGTVLAWGLPDLGAAGTPATGGRGTQAAQLAEQPPWPVPSAPYRPVYENVAVDYPLAPEACDTTHGVDLHDPGNIVSGPYDVTPDGHALAYSIKCTAQNQESSSSLQWGAPTAVPQGNATTAEDCATAFRTSPQATNPTQEAGAVVCLLAAPDPARDRPLMIVRLEFTEDSDMLTRFGYKLSAWTGGPPTQDGGLPQLNQSTDEKQEPSVSPRPPVVTVSAPYQAAYERVPLRLPGKPQACGGRETFLHLHLPKVNHELARSDVMRTPSCSAAKAELQLGTARGAVLQDRDVTPQECAAALAADEPKVDRFTAVKGSTLCLVAESHDGTTAAKLVALTVTKVDRKTGAFDLSASGWTGTVRTT